MPYFRGTRLPLLLERDIEWLLRDEFSTALAAGSVNGTNAEPGPGVRTVVDTGNNISIVGGKLSFDGGTAAWGKYLRSASAIPHNAGSILVGSFAGSDATKYGPILGFSNRTGVGRDYISGNYTAGGSLYCALSGGTEVLMGNITHSTSYKHAILLRNAGTFHYTKMGAIWLLLYSQVIDNGATPYPTILNYNAVSTLDFIRIPTTLWLPTPLLSTSGAMTWPITNGLGHAETTGLGSGGSGKIMTDAGTWSVAGGYVINTPVAGVEKVVNGDMETGDPPTGWIATGATLDGVADERTGGAGAQSLSVTNTGAAAGSASRAVYDNPSMLGKWYSASGWGKVITAGAIAYFRGYSTTWEFAVNITATNWTLFPLATFRCRHVQMGLNLYSGRPTAGDEVRFDDISIKPLPISQLITNCQLSTTDVLAEQVIHAFTLSTQVGISQSDRSFAAKVAALASAGQAILSLKEVTGVGGVGLAATDSLTVNGVTYTLTVAGAGTVAYNDVAKTQTVVLSANLGAEVLADAKVGLDWAAWNGVLCYFDGTGNIRVDEVKAGVYTSRGSTATAFVADKRLIVRKVGTEYRWFFNEAFVTSTTAVDAAAMAGKYFGMFSTLAANTITSMVVYDTGAVTNLYSNLDKYSA